MRIVIHQPYFTPWIGYFHKISLADEYVFLDDVNFRKRFYHDRVKIINMNGEIGWLNLKCTDKSNTQINQVKINRNYYFHCIETIRHSYSKASFYDDSIAQIEIMFKEALEEDNLAITNINLIESIFDLLKLTKPIIHKSSNFKLSSNPTTRIIEICEKLSAQKLLLGNGSSSKVHDLIEVQKKGILIEELDYSIYHPVYSQSRRRNLPFEYGLSILDMIFNCGIEQTRNFLKTSLNGFKKN